MADKIITVIKKNPNITVADISKRLETPKRTIEREIKKFREARCLERVGDNRFGHWEIK